MNLSSRLEQLPVEDWAAAVSRAVRRTRRRIARKPVRSFGGFATVVVILAIGSNALWDQETSHPAPLWGGGAAVADTEKTQIAAHSPVRRLEITAENTAQPDALVARVQEGLIGAGYYAGPADGILTDGTRVAIETFEAERGLEVTGEPSVGLLSVFGEAEDVDEGGRGPEVSETSVVAANSASTAQAAPAAPLPPSISTVSEIQSALNANGYGPLTVDGVMGPRTMAALDEFAATRGLAGQGVTPGVLRALAEATR